MSSGKLRPLVGVRVVDATTDLAGQLCGRILADAGAIVTRLETQPNAVTAPWAEFLNLGKLSSAGSTEEASTCLSKLLSEAHVLLSSGLQSHQSGGLLDVMALNPGLLVVRIPPFGVGPYEAFRSSDAVLSALSGLAHCTPGFPDRQEGEVQPPVQSLAPLAEFGAGLVAALSTTGALMQRLTRATGPKVLEISQLEAAVSLMVQDWGLAAYLGQTPGRRRRGSMLEPNCYLPCKDGYLVIVATRDEAWQALTEVLGSPDWAVDSRFATVAGRAKHWEELHERLRGWASTQSGSNVMSQAQLRGVPCAAVLELRDVLASDQVRVTDALEVVDRTTLPADPVVINGTRRRGRYGTPEGKGDLAPFPDVQASGVGPLAGIRVIDLAQLVAGPLAGQWLSALGADVVIIESRRRPVSRMYGPFPAQPEHDAGPNFNHVNRGKRSVEIDLKTVEGRRLLGRLIGTSDVVLENFSRRAAQSLGLSYPEIKAMRPDIVVASISALGRVGPWGSYVSHHGGIAGLSGLASLTRDHNNQPRIVGAIMPDVLAGTYMALAILQALILRAKTGLGVHVEVSMLDVMLNSMGGFVSAAAKGEVPGGHPARFLQTAEPGRYLVVDELSDASVDVDGTARRARSDAMTVLQSTGVRAASVQDLLEVIADPHLRSRAFVQRLAHPVVGIRPLPGVPWACDGHRPTLGVAPTLGRDTEAVLQGLLDMPTQRIQQLRDIGVLR